MLNRRFVKRGQQLGRVILLTQRDERLEVNLFDISLHGVGFDLALKDTAKLNIGDEVRFICPWSPNLLRQGRYKLRSQHGCRVGAEQTQKLHY